jgi:Ca2+-binding EF-hand superfamily protein
MIAIEKELEQAKINLVTRPDFNLPDAWRIFDFCRKGSISLAEVKDGLAAIGVYPTCQELALWFRRYDQDFNNLLTMTEFSQAFIPFSDQMHS